MISILLAQKIITLFIMMAMGAILVRTKIMKLGAVEKASIIYSNSENLIIPLVTSILGKKWGICDARYRHAYWKYRF